MATDKIGEFLQLDDIREEMSEREIKSSLDIGKIFSEGEEILVQGHQRANPRKRRQALNVLYPPRAIHRFDA